MLPMFSLQAGFRLLAVAVMMGSATAAAAQKHIAATTAPPTTTKASGKAASPIVEESLSGLDLIPNRKTGVCGIRINRRISQPSTLHLIDTKSSRYLVTELLEPSPAPTRAVQVGRLAPGEYKMEVVMTDTTYWKTVRLSR